MILLAAQTLQQFFMSHQITDTEVEDGTEVICPKHLAVIALLLPC
jgi:hypothetical protein